MYGIAEMLNFSSELMRPPPCPRCGITLKSKKLKKSRFGREKGSSGDGYEYSHSN